MKHSIKYLQLCQLSFTLYSTVESLRPSKTDYWIYFNGKSAFGWVSGAYRTPWWELSRLVQRRRSIQAGSIVHPLFMAPAISLGQKWQKNTGRQKQQYVPIKFPMCSHHASRVPNSSSLYLYPLPYYLFLYLIFFTHQKKLNFRVYSCISYPLLITKDKKIELWGSPQLINIDHNILPYIANQMWVW
jgi:hypothetical protein